jgi:hypothetical protein
MGAGSAACACPPQAVNKKVAIATKTNRNRTFFILFSFQACAIPAGIFLQSNSASHFEYILFGHIIKSPKAAMTYGGCDFYDFFETNT